MINTAQNLTIPDELEKKNSLLAPKKCKLTEKYSCVMYTQHCL